MYIEVVRICSNIFLVTSLCFHGTYNGLCLVTATSIWGGYGEIYLSMRGLNQPVDHSAIASHELVRLYPEHIRVVNDALRAVTQPKPAPYNAAAQVHHITVGKPKPQQSVQLCPE